MVSPGEQESGIDVGTLRPASQFPARHRKPTYDDRGAKAMKYLREAKALWKSAVPGRGQADTVQGELLRATEKLRDEAMRNGNVNWDEGHEILLNFLRQRLLDSSELDEETHAQLQRDLDRVADYETPVTSDDLFDRIADCVMEWCMAHATPIAHPVNPDLHR